MTERISEHVSYKEGVRSNIATLHGIDNTPNDREFAAMQRTANAVFEPVRKVAGHPIAINSFFRTRALCLAINPRATYRSEHEFGFAMDLDAERYGQHYSKGMSNAHMFTWLSQNTKFNQLIWEYGNDDEPAWVHISHNPGNNKMGLFIKRYGESFRRFDLDLDKLIQKYL